MSRSTILALLLVVATASTVFAEISTGVAPIRYRNPGDFQLPADALADTDTTFSAKLAAGTATVTTAATLTAYVPVYGHAFCLFSSEFAFNDYKGLMALDTGSSDNAAIGSTCTTCDYTGTAFPANASTPSNVEADYGTGDYTSYWKGYTTTVTGSIVGTSGTAANLNFTSTALNVITSQSNFFRTECLPYNQGIVGLAYSSISTTGNTQTFPGMLEDLTDGPGSFAMELCDPLLPNTDSQQTGHLWLGGYPSSHMQSKMRFTPIVKQDYYFMNTVGIILGNTRLMVPTPAVPSVLDSGSSALFLPSDYAAFVRSEMRNQNAISFSSNVASSVVDAFWTQSSVSIQGLYLSDFSFNSNAVLYFQLSDGAGGNFSVPVDPQDYVNVREFGTDSAGQVQYEVTLLVVSSGVDSQSTGPSSILGFPMHAGKVIYYDRGNNRLGFGISTRDACAMTGPNGGVTPLNITEMDVVYPSLSSGASSLPDATEPTVTQVAYPGQSNAAHGSSWSILVQILGFAAAALQVFASN